MEKPNIYQFSNVAELLAAWIAWSGKRNPKFSMRWFARRLNLKSHAHILRIVAGEKHPSKELVSRIAGVMKLSVDEFAFLRVLADLSRAKHSNERQFLLDRLDTMRKKAPDFLLQLDAFEVISHWYHLAIFEMVTLHDFRDDPKWIAQRLSGVSEEMVASSLARLERLGIVKKSKGKLVRAVDYLTTTHNVPNAAIRGYHAEMLDKAKEALNGVPVAQRYFFGHTMPFDTAKIEEAENLMVEFRRRFHALLEGGTPNSIYHLGIQFVPLTKVQEGQT